MDREKDPIHLLLLMLPKLCRLAIKKVRYFLLRGSAPATPPPPLLPLLAFKFTCCVLALPFVRSYGVPRETT